MEVWIVKMPSGSIEVFSTLRGAFRAVQVSARRLGFPDAVVSVGTDADVWWVEVGSEVIIVWPERVRE